MGCYLFPAVSHRRTHCRIRFLPAFRAAFRPVILGVERIAIARAASLPDSRADFPSRRLFATRTDVLSACDAIPVCHVPDRRLRMLVHIALCRRIASRRNIVTLRPTSPHHLTPSMSSTRSDIAAARLSRRMAPRGAGMVIMACPFGAYRHGSKWCSSDMPDAVPYVRSRRSSGQRIPDTDMEAREVGGMRHACRTTISCDTEFTGISHFKPKSPPVQFRPVRSGAYHIIGMGMALPRVLESRSGYRPWRLGASPLIAGRRGGRGENRMSLEDTWHVAR